MNKVKSDYIAFIKIWISCIVLGILIGALSNLFNGLISPYYFIAILKLDPAQVYAGAIAQGIFEGLIYGIIFSFIFTVACYVIMGRNASYKLAIKSLLKTSWFIGICWLVGGLFAMLLTFINPEFYQSQFPVTPDEQNEMLKFAWVGGSIWGAMIGGVLSVILAIVILRNRWNDMHEIA